MPLSCFFPIWPRIDQTLNTERRSIVYQQPQTTFRQHSDMIRTHQPILKPERKKKPSSRLQRGGRIKPVSATRAKLQKIYSALRKTFLEARPICEWWLNEKGWYLVSEGDICIGYCRIMDVANCLWTTEEMILRFGAARSQDIHHKRGRGKYYLDTSTWMAVSRKAHEKIHADPKTSYEKGYMLPRN